MATEARIAPEQVEDEEARSRVGAVLADVLRGFALRHDRSHGVGHWARVFVNGRELARRHGLPSHLPELFALLHDSRREVEGVDREHGPRAADYVVELVERGILGLPRDELELLSFACRHHSTGRRDGPLMAQICWDADRLDLGRVGIRPLPERLCTDAAREPAFFDRAVAAGFERNIPALVRERWGLEWDGDMRRVISPEASMPRLVFHGTLATEAAGAHSTGFRFRRHEPTLTHDLATACLIYARAATHPNFPNRQDPRPGMCLALRPRGWLLRPAPTGHIWFDPATTAVCGGITKWMGGYLALYRDADESRREEYRSLFTAGTLRTDAAWKRERGDQTALAPADLVGALAMTAAIETWLAELDRDLSGGAPVGLPPDEACAAFGGLPPESLVQAAYEARAWRWLRRAFLSLLAGRGVQIFSTDVEPRALVGTPVLWEPAVARTRLLSLISSFGRRPGFQRLGSVAEACAGHLLKPGDSFDVAEQLAAIDRASGLEKTL
jgi:uncharacterized protein